MGHNNLLVYPDLNEIFEIRTNDKNFKLVAVISQEVKPIFSIVENNQISKKVYSNRKGNTKYHQNLEII